MWLNGISSDGAASLGFQWGSIIKSPCVCTVKSWYPCWYYLRCCQDVRLQQPTIFLKGNKNKIMKLLSHPAFTNLAVYNYKLYCMDITDCYVYYIAVSNIWYYTIISMQSVFLNGQHCNQTTIVLIWCVSCYCGDSQMKQRLFMHLTIIPRFIDHIRDRQVPL